MYQEVLYKLQCKELQEEIDKTQIKHTVQQEHKNVS